MSIGLAYIASDVNKLDYCLEPALLSTRRFADQICIYVNDRGDGTLDLIEKVRSQMPGTDFRIHTAEWSFNRTFQETYRTKAINGLDTDWIIIADADEVFHEQDIDRLLIVSRTTKSNYIRFGINHYYGLPHWIHSHPLWYKEWTRMWRRSEKVKCFNEESSAVVLRNKNNEGVNSVQSQKINLTVHHYGHVRDAKVMAAKQARFKGWYVNDPKTMNGDLPMGLRWEYGIKELNHNNKYMTYVDPNIHPSVIRPWLKEKKYIRWMGSDEHPDNVTNYEVDNPMLEL